MNNLSKFCMSVMLLALSTSCATTYVNSNGTSQAGFPVSLFRNVNSLTPKTENVVVSPYSAAVALSMLTEGAEGQTKEELMNALGNELFKSHDLGANDEIEVKSANSIWIDNHFSPYDRYVSLLEKDYDAVLEIEDFASPSAVKAINKWCSENTNGKITQILDRLDPSNVMVLINALYFNAEWEVEFDPNLTTKCIFRGISGNSDVDMMTNSGTYAYMEQNGVQAIRLPYKGSDYAMYVILPPEGTDIDKIVGAVQNIPLDSLKTMLTPQQVRLRLPRFKVETSMLLNQPLQNMGVKTAFTSMADFSNISQMGPLVVDQVRQKCYVDVTEKGTEAAAVTSIQMKLTSVRPVKQLPVMLVDRPFLFLIANQTDNNVLFAGKIVNL